MTNVVIVGAGHNGLVSAFYLARAGLSVQVLEAQDAVGGACRTQELIPGYRFSTCANVIAWMRPRIVRDMQLFERGLETSGSIVRQRVMSGDRGMRLTEDEGQAQAEIARFSRADSEAWGRWNAFWESTGDLLGPYFLSYPPSLGDVQARARARGHEDLLGTLLTSSLAELADRFFESPEIRGGVEAPHDVGSLYDHGSALIRGLASASASYSETGDLSPRGYVRGGMGRVTELMLEAAVSQGATVRTDAPVRRIVVEGGVARGVELESGEQIAADVVVSNADVKRTFGQLLAEVDEAAAIGARVRSMRTDVAAMKLHCALDELPEFRAFPGRDALSSGDVMVQLDRDHHERAWDAARRGHVPEPPVMIFMTPTSFDAGVAPEGKHTVSIWMHFAPVRLADGTWADRREAVTEQLVAAVDEFAPDFSKLLVDRVLLSPADIEERTLLTDGNIHHIDISPSQVLWQRPCPELARYRTPIDRLYLCGAGQHPYGEVSGGPGHNAAHAVLEDVAGAPTSWQEIERVAAAQP